MGKEEAVGHHQFPQWVKGAARIEGGEIVLDEDRAQTYYIHGPEDLVFDLATLSPRPSPSLKNQDFLSFVRRHGLLWHGPDAVGSGECRESLRKWLFAGFRLALILTFHQRLMEAIETGSVEPVRNLSIAKYFGRDPVTGKPHTDEEYLMVASMELASLVSEGLKGCSQSIAAACGFAAEDGSPMAGPGLFLYDTHPPNLEAAAYIHLAQMIVTRVELADCLGCERTFQPKSAKQKYCTPSCASTNRGRRYRERQASGEG